MMNALKRWVAISLVGAVMGAFYATAPFIANGSLFAGKFGFLKEGAAMGFSYALVLSLFIVYYTSAVPLKKLILTLGVFSFFIPWLLLLLSYFVFDPESDFFMFSIYFFLTFVFPVVGFVIGVIAVRLRHREYFGGRYSEPEVKD